MIENVYVVVPSLSLTQGMKNRATQPFKSITVVITAIQYNIVELVKSDILLTDMFDGYTWYDAEDARYIKDNSAWPP